MLVSNLYNIDMLCSCTQVLCFLVRNLGSYLLLQLVFWAKTLLRLQLWQWERQNIGRIEAQFEILFKLSQILNSLNWRHSPLDRLPIILTYKTLICTTKPKSF